MNGVKLAQFQQAAVDHIVGRLRDRNGSRRMLLADEVGLGKTMVAQGVIKALQKGRRSPLTVIYLCSNAEIAEQNRTKLDPDSRKPIGRITELAVDRPDSSSDLLLYSFTPGTSLKEGTGLAWERRLLMYLLYRIQGFPVWTKEWREFFRCGAHEEHWYPSTTRTELSAYERQTSVAFQAELASAWRNARIDGKGAISSLRELVPKFESSDRDQRSCRNRHVALLRGVMQRVALRHLEPDLVILDEVQRFREVLEEANNSEHIAAELFSRRVPVMILSATPYRALTLAHELAEGTSTHHEDFIRTLEFLFDKDDVTPRKIQRLLEDFGKRLGMPAPAEQLDTDLLKLKRQLEADLTKVICRTERNWYVLDRKKGVDDGVIDSGAMPGKSELEEFFRLHRALAASAGMGQVTEFWKSAPSLLTFLDAGYQLFRNLRDSRQCVPRALLTPADQVRSLASRNHRIAKVVDVAMGPEGTPPRLWTAPTYTYYRDDYYGPAKPRKVLVFSGWRFVPKAVAIVSSRIASDRLGGESDELSQPLRFTDKTSFHVFDVCLPSPFLAQIGQEALAQARASSRPTAEAVIDAAARRLKHHFNLAGVDVVAKGGHRTWQAVMRLEEQAGRARLVLEALDECVADQDDVAAEHLRRHIEHVEQWLRPRRSRLQVTESRLRRLALVAAFSPAVGVLRSCESVYGVAEAHEGLSDIAKLCLGPMRRYFNRPHVQQVIRDHRFRMPWRQMPSEDRGFVERALVYSADAHLQAVMDEYVYLLRHAAQADTLAKAVTQIGDVWTLSRGNPRTNKARGQGGEVTVEENAEVHSTHFGLAFGEDISRDAGPDGDDEKLRKSVVREAFNSPFWPFVLATTSVGQEGLDFHLYCRDVLHWNLPSNPVDLEQREGRINRRDCLAVRESIAKDWPLDGLTVNPWTKVFDQLAQADDLQRYKHGLFPHWVYECRNPSDTVRIQRHVPFFSTSRDAARYERLKAGLALYRLVFGQVNQEDLLDTLQQHSDGATPEDRDRRLRRLGSYMLNLSPIGHEAAMRHARDEADSLIEQGTGAIKKLLSDIGELRNRQRAELSVVDAELDGLTKFVEVAARHGQVTSRIRKAVIALAYLRNPYDHIFDLHVEGGFADDIEVIRESWAAVAGTHE